MNSALQCLAAAAPCKDVKIYPSCIFQVHAPMFVTIKTSLRCLNPHDLCLCLICVGAAILDIPLLCAPRDGAGARAAEGQASGPYQPELVVLSLRQVEWDTVREH